MSPWRLDARSLLARRQRLVVGLDARRAAWQVPGVPACADCAHADVAEALSAGPWRLELVASPEMAVHWIQRAPRAVRGLAELRQVAAARCVQLFGGSPADWRITGDWRREGPFVCAAIPDGWARRVEAPLQARRIPLQWHTSWGWLHARAGAALPREGWLALRSLARVMLWRCTGGAIVHLAQLHCAPSEASGALAARTLEHLRLEAVGIGEAGAETLHWIDLCEAGPVTLPAPVAQIAGAAEPAPPPHEAAATLRLERLRFDSPALALNGRLTA